MLPTAPPHPPPLPPAESRPGRSSRVRTLAWPARLGAGVLAAAAVACSPEAPGAPSPERSGAGELDGPPHVVLFLADDLGWGDVGYHGSEIETPTIDRLCAEGLELDRFYVQQSCTPTRAALLTGRYPIRYGLQAGVIRPWSEFGLDPAERLLPDVLREADYATYVVGKWHLGCAREELLPTRRGFEHHYGLYTGKADSFTRERNGALDWHRDGEPLREEGYTTHLLRDEAVRVVREHDPARPLFLYVPFSAPHFPLQAPEDEVAAYAGLIDDPDRRVYAAMVTCMDEAMAAVLDALEEKGMRARTLVLFLSDNGAATEYGGSNAPLRGEKNGIEEGGVRVPAVASWPGVLEPRKVSERLHVVDLLPTLAGLAGLDPAGVAAPGRPLDGLDVWPLLQGGAPLEREALLVNMAPNRGAVIAGGWKLLIDYQARNNGDLRAEPLLGTELFDLDADPSERVNRAAEALGEHTNLLALLARYRAEMVMPPEERSDALPEDFVVPEVWGPR